MIIKGVNQTEENIVKVDQMLILLKIKLCNVVTFLVINNLTYFGHWNFNKW